MRTYCVHVRLWSVSLYEWFRKFILLFLVIMWFTLGAGAPVGAAEQPDRGGTIVWAVHEGMPHFDIHVEGSYILAQPVGPLYNSLLTFDLYNNEKIVGDLAESWEIASDGKQITFALRKGVQFHDGSDFTCADAKYSLEKLADPKRSSPAIVTMMDSVFASATCRDDFTLIMALKQPSPAILTLLADAHTVMMKAGIAEQVDRKDPKFPDSRWVGTRRVALRYVSSSPPLSTVRATFTAHGAAPLVVLHGHP